MSDGVYHIMLVDDDEVTNFLSREMLKLYLREPVIRAMMNGSEAIEFLEAHIGKPELLPDIILLDINMPVMDGWDFLAEFNRIRSAGFEKIHIFMFTSSVYYEDINKAKTYAWVKDIYSKPLDEEKIKAMLKAAKPSVII